MPTAVQRPSPENDNPAQAHLAHLQMHTRFYVVCIFVYEKVPLIFQRVSSFIERESHRPHASSCIGEGASRERIVALRVAYAI